MTITFDRMDTYAGVATYRVEGYSPKDGRAHGSLDVDIAVCVDCHGKIRQRLIDCGMTPYSLSAVTEIRPCGERTTFSENSFTTKYPA